jgi:hypothetical protein
MNRLIVLAPLALALAACAAPAPVATPEPTPQPTPVVIVKTIEVPGPAIFKTPQVCLDALTLNGQLWELNSRFLDWAVNDKGTWTDADQTRFSDIADDFVTARDACAATVEVI